jgi:hypothetical protein
MSARSAVRSAHNGDVSIAYMDRRCPSQKVRKWLIAERGTVTTYAEVQSALFEMQTPVLRASPHVDGTPRRSGADRRGVGRCYPRRVVTHPWLGGRVPATATL